MARRTSSSNDKPADAQADAAPSGVAGAVVDSDGQVDPEGPQALGIVAPRSYGSGEGYLPGNTAPGNTWLDTESGEVVTSEPEKGTVLTRKGDPVQPFAARTLEAHDFQG
jgi:hypothetical protein